MNDLSQFPGVSQHGTRFRYDISIKGVRHKDSFPSPEEAYVALVALRRDPKAGRFAKNNVTVEEMGERWLRKAPLAPSSKANYEKCLKNYIFPFFGPNAKVREITVVEVSDFAEVLKQKGLAELTRRNILTCLKRMLSRAVGDLVFGPLGVNPVEQLDKDDRPSTKRLKKIRLLTEDEVDRLLEAAHDLKWKAVIGLALYAGLRQGEILDLIWSHVDLRGRRIRVTGDVKTKASDAWVPMIDELHSILLALWEETEFKFGSDYVISSEVRTRYNRGNLDRQVRKCITEAGIEIADDERVSLHTLRHELATALIYAKASDNELKLAMRHSSTQVSRTTYEHVRKEAEGANNGVAEAVALAFKRG